MITTRQTYTYQPAEAPPSWCTTPTMSDDHCPTYQFHSTSAYTPIVGETSYTAGASYSPAKVSRPRKDWGDSVEDQDPVGQWNTPVGEPLILLLLAFLYILYRLYRRTRLIGSAR